MIKSTEDISDVLQRIQDDKYPYGYAGPNSEVLRDCAKVTDYVWTSLGILPKFIARTVEEGLFLEFKNGHRILLEIYNSGDAAILVLTTDGKIIEEVNIPRQGRVECLCDVLKRILKI